MAEMLDPKAKAMTRNIPGNYTHPATGRNV
jgi:hypothetical protein